jgi:hypothetical protein
VSGLLPLEPHALAYDKPLCATLDGFALHAATPAGVLDPSGREALLRYVLRPPITQERVEQRDDGPDGTIGPAVAAVPVGHQRAPPRLHTIRYAGVLGPASPWRRHLALLALPQALASDEPGRQDLAGGYRPRRSFWRAPSQWTCSPVPPARDAPSFVVAYGQPPVPEQRGEAFAIAREAEVPVRRRCSLDLAGGLALQRGLDALL